MCGSCTRLIDYIILSTDNSISMQEGETWREKKREKEAEESGSTVELRHTLMCVYKLEQRKKEREKLQIN